MSNTNFDGLLNAANAVKAGVPFIKIGGRVSAISSNLVSVEGLQTLTSIDSRVELITSDAKGLGAVVQVNATSVLVALFEDLPTLKIGDIVYHQSFDRIAPSDAWLGRVLDPLARPVDGKGPVELTFLAAVKRSKTQRPAMLRSRVQQPVKTGIRAIDIFTPICYGQRVGIFAGSGVGKSTLLGMLARADAFDCVVISLVGERGREVREFVEDVIGKEVLPKTVTIVATSDQSALMREHATKTAMKAAEYYRSQGKRVLFLLDSITRFAHALREIGSAAGEPPVSRGYPASVFAELPRVLERAGPGEDAEGSITALVTVLVDGDDHNEPVADAVRGILDGHIVLDRDIANQGRFPPINLLSSLSRLAPRAWTPDQKALVIQLRGMIAKFEETRDFRMFGSWAPGSDALLDKAVATVPEIYACMSQLQDEPLSHDAFGALLGHLKRSLQSEAEDG